MHATRQLLGLHNRDTWELFQSLPNQYTSMTFHSLLAWATEADKAKKSVPKKSFPIAVASSESESIADLTESGETDSETITLSSVPSVSSSVDTLEEIDNKINNLVDSYNNNLVNSFKLLQKKSSESLKSIETIETTVTTGYFHDKFAEKAGAQKLFVLPSFGVSLANLDLTYSTKIHLQSFIYGVVFTLLLVFLKPLIVHYLYAIFMATFSLLKHLTYLALLCGVFVGGYKVTTLANSGKGDSSGLRDFKTEIRSKSRSPKKGKPNFKTMKPIFEVKVNKGKSVDDEISLLRELRNRATREKIESPKSETSSENSIERETVDLESTFSETNVPFERFKTPEYPYHAAQPVQRPPHMARQPPPAYYQYPPQYQHAYANYNYMVNQPTKVRTPHSHMHQQTPSPKLRSPFSARDDSTPTKPAVVKKPRSHPKTSSSLKPRHELHIDIKDFNEEVDSLLSEAVESSSKYDSEETSSKSSLDAESVVSTSTDFTVFSGFSNLSSETSNTGYNKFVVKAHKDDATGKVVIYD